MKKYFSYDPNGDGFVLHDTAEEATKEAEKALSNEEEQAVDGWSDEVTEICWGEITQSVIETGRRKRTDDDNCSAKCDEVVEYTLRDIAGA